MIYKYEALSITGNGAIRMGRRRQGEHQKEAVEQTLSGSLPGGGLW